MTIRRGAREARGISWIRAARKDFDRFPANARKRAFRAFILIADGGTPDIAKPLSGIGAGVWELALRERGDAWRIVYALRIGDNVWIIHAFQKKSTSGIATPKPDIDLIKTRIKHLREDLS